MAEGWAGEGWSGRQDEVLTVCREREKVTVNPYSGFIEQNEYVRQRVSGVRES